MSDFKSFPQKASIDIAPEVLNTNDKAFWVIGWNDCLEAVNKAIIVTENESTQVGTRCYYTKAIIVYDLGPANNPESIIRAKLIEMGWTPPTIKDIEIE